MRRPLRLLVPIVLAAVPLSAQAAIAGTWYSEFAAQVRIVNGAQSIVKGHARIDLQIKGDSILGSWQRLNDTGAADGPAKALAGTVTATGAHFAAVQQTEIVRREMDNETHLQVIMNYDVAVHGDSLIGTEQWVAVDHVTQGESRPFTATRKP